jgi:acetylornithine deacetylase
MLDYVDEHARDVVTEVADLVRAPSVSGSDEESAIQARLASRLRGLGLEVDHWQIPLAELVAVDGFPGMEVERREAWGLVGRLPGTGSGGPSLMLNAHVDVVPPGARLAWTRGEPFSGAVTGGAVFGRGSCDMKAGLVAALWVVHALAALKVPLDGDLVLACVPGEEDGGLGTFATLARGWRADACVIPEPTGLDLVPASAGALGFRLHVPGRAAHASRRTTGVSAVEKFLPVFRALRELEAHRNRSPDPLMTRWDIAYPIEIGTVHAGDWSSTVPDLLVAEGRHGVALDEPAAEAREAFETAIAGACAADPWLRDHPVRVEWWGGQFAPGRTDSNAPIVAAMRRAHAAVSGRPQQLWGAPYGSDLRLMADIGGVPTVHYGPGAPELAHAPDEHVPIDDLLTATRALAVLALTWCAPHP